MIDVGGCFTSGFLVAASPEQIKCCHLSCNGRIVESIFVEIIVDVFSRYDTELNCIQVLEEFDRRIELADLPAGAYEVVVQGEVVGEFVLEEPLGKP